MKRIILPALVFALAGSSLYAGEEAKHRPQATAEQGTAQQQKARKSIKGRVLDPNGRPIPGVHVKAVGAQTGYITNDEGYFEFLTSSEELTLEFSYIGFTTQARKLKVGSNTIIRLKEDTSALGEVVVTGVINKAKSSYTGAQVTIKKDELLSVGGTRNIIESLSTVVPGLSISENVELGSNPNAKPEFDIRGRTTFSGIANVPVFVVDGAEVSYDFVYDMDMNDIETITVLKDASATALYGAKAAAGVIAITTKAVGEGKLRFSYSGTYRLSMPDLSDYHLLNAKQKLEYERLAGMYQPNNRFYGESSIEEQMRLDQEYERIHRLVLSGIDTDWMSKPLRNGFTQNHSLSIDGGDKTTRYNLGIRYNNDNGVMKGSSRERISGLFKFSYERAGKLFFSNSTSLTLVGSEDSPYGTFSAYTKANPYDSPYNPDGSLRHILSWDQRNPLYEASIGNFSRGDNLSILNTTNFRYWFNKDLRLDTDLSFTRTKNGTEQFTSPLSQEYIGLSDPSDKGRFRESNTKSLSYTGRMTLSYNKNINKFFFNTTLGGNLEKLTSDQVAYTSIGFYSSSLDHPSFAAKYPLAGKPNGQSSISTLAGAFLNANVMYDNRYFVDFVYRYEGSSKFGRNQRFAPFWSIGGGWNLHHEKFIKQLKVVDLLKLRASLGYVGSVNFNPIQALTTYSYSGDLNYEKGIGAIPLGIGNPDLKWERTLNTNVGIDATLFKNRLDLSFDYYYKETNGLLLDITKAPSVGTTTTRENLGAIENRGIELRLKVTPIRTKDIDWALGLTLSSNSNKIKKISNALEAINQRNLLDTTSTKPLPQYIEGESLDALKVVPSAGIDPITGKEIYIKRDGSYTFDYNPRDKVTFGEDRPTVYGALTSYLTYKRWTLTAAFAYSLGGVTYNQTLATRVEGSNPKYNADERVLNERWKQTGDIALYRDIKLTGTPRQTSRFVRTNNYLSFNTLSLSYDFSPTLLKRVGVRSLRMELQTKDLFYISTVKRERGLEYPFARSVELSFRFAI